MGSNPLQTGTWEVSDVEMKGRNKKKRCFGFSESVCPGKNNLFEFPEKRKKKKDHSLIPRFPTN